MKQTAVEWLDSQLDFLHKYMSECDRINLFDQAKEMEEEQIKDAWKDGAYGGGQFTTTFDTAEQYYNETFKE